MCGYDEWLDSQAEYYNAGCGQSIFIGKDEDGIPQFTRRCEICDIISCENNPNYVLWLEREDYE